MSWGQDEITVGKRLMVGAGRPAVVGAANKAVPGSCYIEGPIHFGNARKSTFIPQATLVVAGLTNPDTTTPIIPGALCGTNNSPYSLAVIGDACIFDNLEVNRTIHAGSDIVAQGDVRSKCGVHRLSAKKNFDIPHPSKKGYRLRHTCPEGPSNDVYVRGRVTNKKEIALPDYWKDFVDHESITVSLTPIGAHQDVIVKRIDSDMIHLQSKGGMPIDCFYHIFAERKDGERLIVEYKGKSPADYPGNNDEYSVSGYHYDVKEN